MKKQVNFIKMLNRQLKYSYILYKKLKYERLFKKLGILLKAFMMKIFMLYKYIYKGIS